MKIILKVPQVMWAKIKTRYVYHQNAKLAIDFTIW